MSTEHIDPTTGLRRLPEDNFWRVGRSDVPSYPYKISRMKVRRIKNNALIRLFSAPEFREVVVEVEDYTTIFDLEQGAASASVEAWKLGVEREYDRRVREQVIGDYPPKRYENRTEG